MEEYTFDKIVNHVKTSGFVYPGSEIYNGLANAWDYGPLGVELKNNLKKLWWKKFVQECPYNVGLDSAILMNPNVWKASGHLATFSDPLMDCKNCKTRHRADKLVEEHDPSVNAGELSDEALMNYIKEHNIACPNCGSHDFSEIRKFNLMYKTYQGVLEDAKSTIYLRPETAQGIFVNFKNIQRTTRKKIPFGVGQIGKSFRNEITPGNFIFRIREFEQMELEFFCKPGEDLKWYDYWKSYCYDFVRKLGVDENNLRLREHSKEELCFYSKGTCDIEYKFPFGWGELWGIADRTDYDLTQHSKFSGVTLDYIDPSDNSRYIPYCVEPSLGVDRLTLLTMCEAYKEEEVKEGDSRIVMKLHPAIAPYKACICPLSKQLADKASEVYTMLSKHFMVEYDEAGSIGKRYRRQDAIGTPMCITIDFDTENDDSVTIRDRDTMEQVRVNINDLKDYIDSKLEF